MMGVLREKISNDKQGFIERVIDRFVLDPRCFQRLFLSDADKSCYVKYSHNMHGYTGAGTRGN